MDLRDMTQLLKAIRIKMKAGAFLPDGKQSEFILDMEDQVKGGVHWFNQAEGQRILSIYKQACGGL